MRTILITGFGRFPGAAVNPSGTVAQMLARRRRPALAATRLIAHVFATSYEAVDRELPALLSHEKPDAIVLFGLASRARHVRVERMARNRVSVLFPDVRGARPERRAIVPGGQPIRHTPLPIARI